MWRWIAVGGLLLLLLLGFVIYERRPLRGRAARSPSVRHSVEPAGQRDSAPPLQNLTDRVAPDRLAWDLHFARVGEERAAVAAQAFFPEMQSRLVDDLISDDFDRTQGAIAGIRYLGSEQAAVFLPEIEAALAAGRTTGALYAAIEEVGTPASGLSHLMAAQLIKEVEDFPRGMVMEPIPGIDVGTPASALGAVLGEEGIPALRAAMVEPIYRLTEDAVDTVARLGPRGVAARAELLGLLRQGYLELDEGVSRALVATDPDGREILPILRAMASDPDAPRAGIAQVFRRLGATEETERLAGWLDRQDGRRDALDALAAFGTRARAAIPAIERLMETWRDDERAYLTLAAIDPERIPELITRILARPPRMQLEGDYGLDDAPWDERPANLATLGRWGSRARSALPRIVELLANPDIHPSALGAAAAIDPEGESWTPTAFAWLSSRRWLRQESAVDAFCRAGRFTPDVQAAVIPLLAESFARDDAAQLLAHYDEVPVELVASLLFDHPAALRALAKVPVIPREYLEALVPIAGQHPREGMHALARLDREGMKALRDFVATRAPNDAPPSPAAITRVLKEHDLTRDEARAVLRAGLPDHRCVEALGWLE